MDYIKQIQVNSTWLQLWTKVQWLHKLCDVSSLLIYDVRVKVISISEEKQNNSPWITLLRRWRHYYYWWKCTRKTTNFGKWHQRKGHIYHTQNSATITNKVLLYYYYYYYYNTNWRPWYVYWRDERLHNWGESDWYFTDLYMVFFAIQTLN